MELGEKTKRKNQQTSFQQARWLLHGGSCEASTKTHNLCTHQQGWHQITDEGVRTQPAVHFKPNVFSFLMLQWLKMIFSVHSDDLNVFIII